METSGISDIMLRSLSNGISTLSHGSADDKHIPNVSLEGNEKAGSSINKDQLPTPLDDEIIAPFSNSELEKISHEDNLILDEPRGSKRKRNISINPTYMDNFDPPYQAATEEEKISWQGFCEIESEPAIFNSMLRQWGVRGVKIQEMFGVDDEYLLMLPQPVYGLIFLFQYMDEDAGSQEEQCPSHVWFANQVTNNSCASVALLNMVNNIPSIKLGQDLETFRNFTNSFSPSMRGEQVANFSFIKRIHNSFARKIDMLTADMSLLEDFEESKRKKPRKGKSAKKKSKTSVVDDSAFHFVAYMPVCGDIWKLDGLDSTPQEIMKLPSETDISSPAWLIALAPLLQSRMADCEDGGIQFNLLALVQDPFAEAQEKLLRNIRLSAAMGIEAPDLETYGLSREELEEVPLNPQDEEKLNSCSSNAEDLAKLKEQVHRDGELLRSAVMVEKATVDAEEEKASDRRNDYGPFLQKWLMLLSENGSLKELAEED